MSPTLNIRIFVDVIALLLGHPADGAVFLYDDSPYGGSEAGTAKRVSPVWPGQLVRWSVTPLDVQTPVWLADLPFGENGPPPAGYASAPWALQWQGYIPEWLTPGAHYPYRLVLATGALTGRTLSLEGPSLLFMPPPPPPLADAVAVPAADPAGV